MSEHRLTIKVECHAGYRGEEAPQRLRIGESRIEVYEILDRWLAPEYRYFKIRGDDDAVYIIRHDTKEDQWELTFFDSGRASRDQLSST